MGKVQVGKVHDGYMISEGLGGGGEGYEMEHQEELYLGLKFEDRSCYRKWYLC